MADKRGRVNEIIKRNLSEIIIYNLKNELCKYASISDIKLSEDYSYCKVYVSHLDDNKLTNLVNFLNKRKGMIRTMLSKKISIYKTPELSFHIDETFKNASHIDKLIEEANNSKMYTLKDLKNDQAKRKVTTYDNLIKKLEKMSDKKLSLFNEKLINNVYSCYGIKMDDVKSLADEFESVDLSKFELDKYLEINLIYFIISLKKINTLQSQIEFINKNKEHLKTWAITDTIISYLKFTNLKEDAVILSSLLIGNEYTKRIRYYALNKYKSKENVSRLLELIYDDKSDVVIKAIAYLIEELYYLDSSKVLNFLYKDNLSIITKKEVIKKVKESNKIKEIDKNKIQSII